MKIKTCSKCSRPCHHHSTVCTAHRVERDNETRRARYARTEVTPETIRASSQPGALKSGVAIEMELAARPTAPGAPEPRCWEPPAELSRVLIIPDVHRPDHDKRAWELVLRAGRAFKPDKIVVLGDFADFYSVSSFDKNPKKASDLKREADDANVGLDELDALGASSKIFIKGNHEDRLERYLCKAAPALIGCVSVDELFRFAERGWQVVDYKKSTRLGKLRLTHDTGTAGQNAHRQSMDAFQASVVIGHTHRMEMTFKGCADGNPTVGAMFGWLGDFDQIDYMQAVKARRDWVHGFGIGYQEQNGVIHLQPVPIINGACVVGGVLIR